VAIGRSAAQNYVKRTFRLVSKTPGEDYLCIIILEWYDKKFRYELYGIWLFIPVLSLSNHDQNATYAPDNHIPKTPLSNAMLHR